MHEQIYLVKSQNFKEIKKVTEAIFKYNNNNKIRYNYLQLVVTNKVLELDWLQRI